MTLDRVHTTVYLTLADDLHDFNTLEIILEPLTNSVDLEDYYDEPADEFRYEIIDELRDTSMWKAGLNNPDGKPYKIKLGTITIDTETDTLSDINFDKTSHHSIEPHELTIRD